jgi:hypothetical protein
VSLLNGRGRGSARSVEGFHLFQGLTYCRQALHKYGGHAAAAGFEMAADQVAPLQDLLEQAFEEQVGLEPPRPTLKVDAQVELHELDRAFNRHLETLRPFGPGNPAPVIVCLGVQCLGSRVINQRHLKVQLAQGGGNVIEAIAFDQATHHPLDGTTSAAVPRATRSRYDRRLGSGRCLNHPITRGGPPWTYACWIGAAPEKVWPPALPFYKVPGFGFWGKRNYYQPGLIQISYLL